ncbi:MAG: hypothetical protein LBE50_01765 [Gallionellaceae bacterium]|nr:hypothetical protein [Gallionellaceae bacterium]
MELIDSVYFILKIGIGIIVLLLVRRALLYLYIQKERKKGVLYILCSLVLAADLVIIPEKLYLPVFFAFLIIFGLLNIDRRVPKSRVANSPELLEGNVAEGFYVDGERLYSTSMFDSN